MTKLQQFLRSRTLFVSLLFAAACLMTPCLAQAQIVSGANVDECSSTTADYDVEITVCVSGNSLELDAFTEADGGYDPYGYFLEAGVELQIYDGNTLVYDSGFNGGQSASDYVTPHINDYYTVNGILWGMVDPSSSGDFGDTYWTEFSSGNSIMAQITAPTTTLSVATSDTPSTYGSPVTFTATISSGPTGTITFYDGSTAIGTGTISGTTATFTTSTLAVGTHTITAGWPGNSNYSALTSAAITQVVNQAPQTIIFPAPPSPVTYGVSPIALSATASSGLAVSFNLVSGPGSISGSTLTITGVGTVVVSASQAGNANYMAAQVTHSIVVNPATPVINWATPSSISYGAALSAAQLNATASYNGISVPGTFEYMPASGAILNAGTQQLLVFFTPNNSTDYTSASGSVTLVVNIPYSGGPAPATIYSYSITGYAPNGNLLGYTDSVTGAWSNFGYDGVNRLVAGTQAAISGEQLSVSQSFCWTYDGFGNRTAQEIGSQPFTNAAGAACQLPSNATLYSTALANYTAANQISSTNARGVVVTPLYAAAGEIMAAH